MALPLLIDLTNAYDNTKGKYLANLMLQQSPLLQKMGFVSGGRASAPDEPMKYNYSFLSKMRVAAGRATNTNYTPDKTERSYKTVTLKTFGGRFSIDRKFISADGTIDPSWIQENFDDIARATVQKLSDDVINGDVATDPLTFDGLNKLTTGTGSHVDATAATSLVDLTTGRTDKEWLASLEVVTKYIKRIRGFGLTPVIMGNETSILRLETIGTGLGFVKKTKNNFGIEIPNYQGADMIDLGVVGSTDGTGADVIPTAAGSTDIYITGMGARRGFIGVAPEGNAVVRTYGNLYDDGLADAVRSVDAEITAAVALGHERGAYALRGVKVA